MKKIMKKKPVTGYGTCSNAHGRISNSDSRKQSSCSITKFYGNQTVYYETNSPYTTWKVNVPILTAPKQHRSRI